jgi:S-adenosyl methyltransferase
MPGMGDNVVRGSAGDGGPGRFGLAPVPPEGLGLSLGAGVPRPGPDATRPHAARMYDFYLGGKSNYAVDREAAERVLKIFPADVFARTNRAFMHRTARFLASHGIDQFLDIGTGIPTSPNLHEVVQQIAPHSRVVYVDHDLVVLRHAEALMTSTPQGRCAYVEADLRHPETILNAAEVRDTLDLTRPVALSLIAVLHFVPDADDPYAIVRALLAALPAGSWLALSHVTADFAPIEIAKVQALYRESGIPAQARTRSVVAQFAAGLQPAMPGVVAVHEWRPDLCTRIARYPDEAVSCYGLVAHKPATPERQG